MVIQSINRYLKLYFKKEKSISVRKFKITTILEKIRGLRMLS